MLSPISFTSRYRITNNNGENIDPNAVHYGFNHAPEKLQSNITGIVNGDNLECQVPDYLDLELENFCASRGIKLIKRTEGTEPKTEDLLKPESIKSRIKEASEGFEKVEINTKKLKELERINSTYSNLRYCEDRYYYLHKDKINEMLKSGDDIPASTLYIYKVPNTNHYSVDFFGKDHDQYVYFALKDLGMKKVPVYVNEETKEACKILGLI